MNWYKKAILDEERLNQVGYEVIECKTFRNYQLCLVEADKQIYSMEPLLKYQLTINTLTTDATNVSDQNQKFKFSPTPESLKDMYNIRSTITSWIGRYNPICIMSLNTNKSDKYPNILSFLLKGTSIKIQTTNIMGHTATILTR